VQLVIIAVVGTALFLFPGYALLVIFRDRLEFDFVEMLCAASGLSIAVVPLVLYGSSLLDVRLVPSIVVLVLLIAGGISTWDWQQRFARWRKQGTRRIDGWHIALGIVFLATLAARLWMVRGIVYPLWTDSYHHTMITQIIADTGIVPSSYQPYAPIEQFTYHFGFHTLAAWFHWLSGYAVPRSVVLVGQIINALVVPTTYLLTARLFHSRRAGVVSALVVGLLSQMPTLYVNWGRYPQLSGQILLPVLLVLTLDALDLRAAHVRRWLLVGLGAAGLFLVHNRIFLFFGMFAAWLFVFKLAEAWGKPDQVKRLLIASIVMAATMLIVDASWLWRFFSGFGANVAREVVGGYKPQRYGEYFTFQLQDLFSYGMWQGWLLVSAIGALIGMLKKDSGVLLIVLWIASLFIAANLHLVGVTPFFSSLIVITWIYLPLVALIGYLADHLIALVTPFLARHPQPSNISRQIAVAAFAILCLGGVIYTAGLIEPENGFVRPADLAAMQWIQENVPQDALFHIKTHFWTPAVAHGLDAGYWIPLLTRRQTTIPPEVYASDGSLEQFNLINQRARELVQVSTPEQLWRVLTKYKVTHIYIGSRPTDLRPDFFQADPIHFRSIYQKDGVWIFLVVVQ